MLWSTASEFVQNLARRVVYGYVGGTAGLAREAEPIQVDAAGVVQVNDIAAGGVTPVTLTDIVTQDIICPLGAGTTYGPFVDIVGYKGIGWFISNIGANPINSFTCNYASGLAGAGFVTAPYGRSAALAGAAGDIDYFDQVISATNINQPNPWHPLFCRSMQIGFNSPAGTTMRVLWIGAMW